NFIKTYYEGEKLLLLAPIHLEKGRTMEDKIKVLQQQGYSRIKIGNEVVRIEEVDTFSKQDAVFLVVDRIITKTEEDFYIRLADAIQTAFFEGKGECYVESLKDNKQ